MDDLVIDYLASPLTGPLCDLVTPGNTFYQPDMDNIHSANGNADLGDTLASVSTSEVTEGHLSNVGSLRSSPPSVVVETPQEAESTNTVSSLAQSSPAPSNQPEDQNNNKQRVLSSASPSVGLTSPPPSPPAPAPLPKVGLAAPAAPGRLVKYR